MGVLAELRSDVASTLTYIKSKDFFYRNRALEAVQYIPHFLDKTVIRKDYLRSLDSAVKLLKIGIDEKRGIEQRINLLFRLTYHPNYLHLKIKKLKDKNPYDNELHKVLDQVGRYLVCRECTVKKTFLFGKSLEELEIDRRHLKKLEGLSHDPMTQSWIELSEGGSSKSCIWELHPSGEVFLKSDKIYERPVLKVDTTGYPVNDRYASDYLRFLDSYQGEIFPQDPAKLAYFRSSTLLASPGQKRIDGTSFYLNEQVANDLPRLNALVVNKTIIYDEFSKNLDPIVVIKGVNGVIGDWQLTLAISKMITQATIADAATDFYYKFSNEKLQYHVLNADFRRVIIRTSKTMVEVQYQAIFGIRNFHMPDEKWETNKPPVLRFGRVTSQIVVPKSTLMKNTLEGVKINTIFSKFYPPKSRLRKRSGDRGLC